MAIVFVDVEVDLGEIDTSDLRDELIARNADPDEDDPVDRIWKAVVYQGIPLDDVVDELMRERGWRWPHVEGK